MDILKCNEVKDSTLVSVIIPCYNQGHFLHDCLQSLIKSTHKRLEIIIVNDGSNLNSTLEVLNKVKILFPELDIHIFNQENSGLSSARNTGISKAKGEYIQLLDCDDLITPTKLEKQLDLFRDNSYLIAVISDYLIANEDLSIETKPYPPTISNQLLDLKLFITRWEKELSIPIHCALFKSTALKEISFPEYLRAKEDWVFWTLLIDRYGKNSLFYHQDHFAIYRYHQSSMTKKDQLKMLKEWMKAYAKLYSLYGNLFNEKELLDEADLNAKHIYRSYFRQFKPETKIISMVKKTLRNFPKGYVLISRILKKIKLFLVR